MTISPLYQLELVHENSSDLGTGKDSVHLNRTMAQATSVLGKRVHEDSSQSKETRVGQNSEKKREQYKSEEEEEDVAQYLLYLCQPDPNAPRSVLSENDNTDQPRKSALNFILNASHGIPKNQLHNSNNTQDFHCLVPPSPNTNGIFTPILTGAGAGSGSLGLLPIHAYTSGIHGSLHKAQGANSNDEEPCGDKGENTDHLGIYSKKHQVHLVPNGQDQEMGKYIDKNKNTNSFENDRHRQVNLQDQQHAFIHRPYYPMTLKNLNSQKLDDNVSPGSFMNTAAILANQKRHASVETNHNALQDLACPKVVPRNHALSFPSYAPPPTAAPRFYASAMIPHSIPLQSGSPLSIQTGPNLTPNGTSSVVSPHLIGVNIKQSELTPRSSTPVNSAIQILRSTTPKPMSPPPLPVSMQQQIQQLQYLQYYQQQLLLMQRQQLQSKQYYSPVFSQQFQTANQMSGSTQNSSETGTTSINYPMNMMPNTFYPNQQPFIMMRSNQGYFTPSKSNASIHSANTYNNGFSFSAYSQQHFEKTEPRIKRRRLNAHQLYVLDTIFEKTCFPSAELRHQLGQHLGLSPRTIQIWFQNRRQSSKNKAKTVEQGINDEPNNDNNIILDSTPLNENVDLEHSEEDVEDVDIITDPGSPNTSETFLHECSKNISTRVADQNMNK
jgi:hypothetical protein